MPLCVCFNLQIIKEEMSFYMIDCGILLPAKVSCERHTIFQQFHSFPMYFVLVNVCKERGVGRSHTPIWDAPGLIISPILFNNFMQMFGYAIQYSITGSTKLYISIIDQTGDIE